MWQLKKSSSSKEETVTLVRRAIAAASVPQYATLKKVWWKELPMMAGIAAGCAVLTLGVLAANNTRASSAPEPPKAAPVLSATRVTVTVEERRTGIIGGMDELEKLIIRNRRLEALVTVLQRRAENRNQPPTSEPTVTLETKP